MSKLFENRILRIDSEINEEVSKIICSSLLILDQEDSKKPIQLYINTPGGSVIDGLAIIDTMMLISAPIHAIAIGLVASMGIPILVSADKRYSTKNTRFMIHNVSAGARGHIEDMKIQINNTEILGSLSDKIMFNNTTVTPNIYKKKASRDWWLSSEEALEYNIVDEILEYKKPEKKTFKKTVGK